MTESTYESTDDVAVLTLSNPPANLFTLKVGEDIRSGVERAKAERARAMVIQADGAVFSGGADVSLFKDRSLEESRDLMIGFMPILTALEDAPFPVIAAVHGLCFAAGLELSLACDLIIAAEGTQFAQVEALIGATTFGGGVYRLSERCGPARAREITFGADSYSAEQFERWNIINRVVPGDQLRGSALEWAQNLAKGPTAAHAATKEASPSRPGQRDTLSRWLHERSGSTAVCRPRHAQRGRLPAHARRAEVPRGPRRDRLHR